MPHSDRKLIFERLYSIEELIQLHHQMLRFARSFPPGPELNQHRQVAFIPARPPPKQGLANLNAHTIRGFTRNKIGSIDGTDRGPMHYR